MTAPAPETLGGYILLDRIGKGGMGEVWRAERVGMGAIRRRAALKRILPQYQHDAVLRERFMAEARITARLAHPNICQLIDFGDAPELYLVLEFIDGITVGEVLRRSAARKTRLPVAAALYIIAEAATAP